MNVKFYKAETVVWKGSVKKVFLKIMQNSGLRSATLLKRRLWHSCFPVNFVKFLRIPFLTENLRWLLLKKHRSSIFVVVTVHKM